MWIPAYTQPRDPDVRLAVITSAQALGAAVGVKKILLGIYEKIMMVYPPEDFPEWVRVCTHDITGDGIQLTPIEAYHANENELLGKEKFMPGPDVDVVTSHPYRWWRKLYVLKLYKLLEDEKLPKPKES